MLECLKRIAKNDIVYVAMSSGVDSSTVAALLAKNLGPDRVRGVFMNNWSSTAKCSETDWNQVKHISSSLRIQCHRVDLEKDYWTQVFEPMIAQYANGLTPNPDVSCNRQVKFGSLLEHLKARDPDFKWIATGHYADASPAGLLRRPSYRQKDQSYYLATTAPSQLAHALFPLSNLSKPEVRGLARDLNLLTADKPDSQGLCFVEQTQKSFSSFLSEYIEPNPGSIVLEDGRVVGKHNGLWSATIGQRTTLSLPQSKPDFQGSWFYSKKIPEKNQLVIVRGHDNPSLYHDTVRCRNFVWHSEPKGQLFIQYRSLQESTKAQVDSTGPSPTFTLQTKRRAIAPGQYIVVYDNDLEVIGAGQISNVL